MVRPRVSTDPAPSVDEVSQDQAELDKEQEATEEQAPEYLTKEQTQGLLQAQAGQYQGVIGQLQSQVKGLQSKIDSGLNSIRAFAEASEQQRREALLAEVPEEHRAWAGKFLEAAAPARQPFRPVEAPAEAPSQDVEQQSIEQWRQVKSIVESFGVDPNDSRVDYAALTEPGLTAEQRQRRFLGSVSAIVKEPPKAAPIPKIASQRTPREPQSPAPATDHAGGRTGGYRNVHDVLGDYGLGKLTKEEKDRLVNSLGGLP